MAKKKIVKIQSSAMHYFPISLVRSPKTETPLVCRSPNKSTQQRNREFSKGKKRKNNAKKDEKREYEKRPFPQ